MNITLPQITQQIGFLNAQHLEELNLFVQFLMSKQQRVTKTRTKLKKAKLLNNMQPLNIPVSHYIIQRDMIYDDRI